MVIRKRVDLYDWIWENTSQSNNVLELGAGFFDKLEKVNSNVKNKIGIEIWEPYIQNSKFDQCEKIKRSIFDYKELVDTKSIDTIMMIDILEHFEKEPALNLLKELIENFDTALLMIPEGNHPQESDVTGFDAHEYQRHRSSWAENEFLDLEPTEIIVDSVFHLGDPVKDSGCIFLVWNKNTQIS